MIKIGNPNILRKGAYGEFHATIIEDLNKLKETDKSEYVNKIKGRIKPFTTEVDIYGHDIGKEKSSFLPISKESLLELELLDFSDFNKGKYANMYFLNKNFEDCIYMLVGYKGDTFYCVVMNRYVPNTECEIAHILAANFSFSAQSSTEKNSANGRFRLRTGSFSEINSKNNTKSSKYISLEEVLLQLYGEKFDSEPDDYEIHHVSYRFDLRLGKICRLTKEDHDKLGGSSHDYYGKVCDLKTIPILR